MSDEHKPYIPPSESPAEFTVKAVILGSFFGLIFGMANTYIGLTAGITVSTSIPIAVMTVAAFRGLRFLGGRATILENNMSQTVGSASSSLASGVIFTIPALFLWGANPSLFQIGALSLLGAFLGITFMIPLRRYLIVKEHRKLPYPEGTACSEVLISSEKGGAQALPLFVGLGVGFVFKFFGRFMNIFQEKIAILIPGMPKAEIGMGAKPALLGVGFILGYRISAVMVAGSLISWGMIIPLISLFGDGLTAPVFPETARLIANMSPAEIWTRYIRYLGAGAVATAGIITVIRSVPIMVASFRLGASALKKGLANETQQIERTSRDLPIKWILSVVAVIILVIALIPGLVGKFDVLTQRIVVALAITIFAFFFVTVSSRIVGLIGVSSNPTSGMTIVTLLGTSMVFYMLGWTDTMGKITALSVGTVVCVAASIAGDTSQDLKTGYLVGATPFKQQIGEYIGASTSFIGVAFAVTFLHQAYGFGTVDLPAPQAMLMKTVIDGVLSAQVPWGLVFIGAGFALVVEMLGISSLPFAVGMYLPVSTMTPIFAGGLLRRLVDRRFRNDDKLDRRREAGILYSSGLITGEGLFMVGLSAYTYFIGISETEFSGGGLKGVFTGLLLLVRKLFLFIEPAAGVGYDWLGGFSTPFTFLLFLMLGYSLYYFTRRRPR